MTPAIILISANAEWRAVRPLFPMAQVERTPFGETFMADLGAPPFQPGGSGTARFLHGGWGKIAAAASTQYAIDRWQPELLVNLGTCGGFQGQIAQGEIVLAEKTIVYDIFEQMGDQQEHIDHYSTALDLSWLPDPPPIPVRRTLLVSGDRDLVVEEAPELVRRYGAAAGDWESGAIAWTAARNGVRLLVLRGVTDLVSAAGNETYGNLALFEQAAAGIMRRLVESLPGWLVGFEQ
jgi:adenosylhomocysteine nucleosidase